MQPKNSLRKSFVKKTSPKLPSRLSIDRKCAESKLKKPSRKNSQVRDDGFYTWFGFVTRWRQREENIGNLYTFKTAMEKAKEPWERYKERNEIVTNTTRKNVLPDGAFTWPLFVKKWAKENDISFREALTSARNDWQLYKKDPDGFDFSE